jgi:PAS domain S-box-containing protein
MNDTAAWPEAIPAVDTEKQPSMGRYPFIAAVVVLVLGLSASAWIYFAASRAVSRVSPPIGTEGGEAASALLKQFDNWVIQVIAVTAAGGVGFLLLLAASTAAGRREWLQRLQSHDADWRKTMAALYCQVAESRQLEVQSENAEAVARKQAADLAYAHAQLEAELNQLKRAEKNLSQQRQSLEVSKSVLELHVEARTKELQKLQRRYEHILNSAGEGICGLDLEGRASFANPAAAKITGWAVQDLIGMPESEIFGLNGADGPAVSPTLNPGEQMFHRKDGAPFAAEFVRTSINENGRVMGSVVVFKDITERKRVDERLAQKAAELARSNSELEQFAFVASHDLQEPLRKIQAFGDRLKTKCQGAIAADAHDYLERMQSASARMRTLIDDLLTFSRVIRSSEPFVSVDLSRIAKEVLGDLELRLEKSGANIEVGNLPKIEADALQMRQLLLNLLTNALKFQPPGAHPVVKVQARTFNLPSGEEMCELTVADNGIGFEEKYLEKIFAVFQRLHGRAEYEGTGVGLAVCRRIADRHHGDITAKSQLGQGATFVVTLPMRQAKAQTAQ